MVDGRRVVRQAWASGDPGLERPDAEPALNAI